MRLLLVTLAFLLFTASAFAEVPGVTVTLVSGDVVGQTRGLGTATVTARVTNETARTLEGIRLVSWYSAVDVLPAADADWRIHEFVFDPPLMPGASGTLTFTDENAAQYVKLEARQVKYRAALRYGDAITDLKLPLLRRSGVVYVALRDLVDITGGTLRSSGEFISVNAAGKKLQLRPGSAEAQVDSSARSMSNAVIEDNDRSYIALRDAASLLELELVDLGDELYELK